MAMLSIQDGPPQADDDIPREHSGPAYEHIFEQMQISSSFVQRSTTVQFPCGETVHCQTEHRDADHAQRVRAVGAHNLGASTPTYRWRRQ